MGGVINIITRKGSKTPRRNVTVEAGSYGTLSTRATLSGGDDRWTYSLGVNLLHSDGFPRYGYRIDRPLTDGAGDPLPPLPSDDPTNKGGLVGRFTYKLSEDATIDAGFSLFGNALRFDNPYAFVASDVFNPYNHSLALIGDGFVRANFDSPGGTLHNSLTLFSNVTDRDIWEAEGCYDADLHAVQLPQRLSWRSLRRRVPGRPQARRLRRFRLRRAQRNRTRAHLADRRTRTTDRSRRSTPSRSPIPSSPSSASSCSTGSTSRSAAGSTRSKAAKPSTPGARRRPTISTRRERSCAPAPAQAPRRRRSTSVSASSASPASRRSRASASTPASTRRCSTAARPSRRPSSTRAIAI